MLTWATGLASPGGAVSPDPNPEKSIDVRHRPTVLAQDSVGRIESLNGMGWWRVGGLTNRLDNYEIHGDRQGQVTVRDLVSGEIVRRFQMPEERVIRTTWLLDEGEVAAASQLHQTVFWDMETGEEISRLDYQVYAFSHDGKKLIAFDNQEGFFLYDYPNLRRTCSIPYARAGGPLWMRFSPDDRYLATGIQLNRPAGESYPIGNRGDGDIRGRLLDLGSCQIVREVSNLRLLSVERTCFDRNSSYLYIEGAIFISDLFDIDRDMFLSGVFPRRNLRLDLDSREIEEVTATALCN